MQIVECNYYEKLENALNLVVKREMNKDKFSELLYKAYHSGNISRQDYHNLFNDLEKRLGNDLELRSIRNRADNRTLGEFALVMYDNTYRERILAEAWVHMCEELGFIDQVRLEDNGMANNGQVMFGRHKVNHEPDFRITLGASSIEIPKGTHKLEVKYCPTDKFITYKTWDLESYVKDKAYVLTLIGENRMIGANGDLEADSFDMDDLNLSWWVIFTPSTMQKMLLELPTKRYPGCMGGKPAVRVHKENFADFFEVKNWSN